MNYPTEYILRCGYYPDTFAAKDIPPDEFFMHRIVSELALDLNANAWLGAARHMLILCEAAGEIIDAIKDKYRLDMGGPYSRAFNVQDCFWSLSVRPDEVPEPVVYGTVCITPEGAELANRMIDGYCGADDEYPENAS